MYFQTIDSELTLDIIKRLKVVKSNFEYVEGLEDLFKRGQLQNRYIHLNVNESEILGYVIFTRFNQSQANAYVRKEGCDTIVPNNIPYFLFIDIMDVSMKYQRKGLGTNMLNYLRSFNLPILLQNTEDSEDFWYANGIKPFDYSWCLGY